METVLTGFKHTGKWEEIVIMGEIISDILDDAVSEDFRDSFERWDSWRPKIDEDLEKEVTEKTADEASVNEGEGEEKDKNASDDLKKAGEKLSDSIDTFSEEDKNAATDGVKESQESAKYVGRAVDSLSRKALRKVEKTVYKNVMTKVSPYYFDSELISANLTQESRLVNNNEKDDGYTFEVRITDDEIRDKIEDQLEKELQRELDE